MNHLDATTLNLYLDDGLDPPTRRQVETHLAACAACQGEVDAMRALFASFGTWRAEPIPRDVTPHVLTRIAHRPSSVQVSRWGAALLGAQLVIAVLILMWLLPTGLRVLNGLPLDTLSLFDVNALAQLPAITNSFALPFPSIALWVWLLAILGMALIWLVGNRLILGSVERTEASQ